MGSKKTPYRGKILVIHDGTTRWSGLARSLARMGYDYTPVSTAREAGDLMESTHFDAVIHSSEIFLTAHLPGPPGSPF